MNTIKKKEDTSIDYKNYIIFILGYDLINKELKESDQPECDLAFKQCKTLMEEFINSKYDRDTKSLYECLEDFIEEKTKKYLKTIDKIDKIWYNIFKVKKNNI